MVRSVADLRRTGGPRILVRGPRRDRVVGFGLALLQLRTGWITLKRAGYYLSTVPIHLDVVRIASVELGILVACAAAMFLPARYISKLKPVESLRFTDVPDIFDTPHPPDHERP